VDQVQEVLSLEADHIEPAPSFDAGSTNADFILGIGKADQRVVFLLDIGRVLSGDAAKTRVPGVTA
jgi:purine-binding chemotaxis protein CheW